MNHIKHLTGFYNKSNQDPTITPSHISIYLALFQRWNLNRFKNPIIISRTEIMIAAKIKSKATYHKCIKELHQKQYIIYKPSYNPYEGTEVILPDLSNPTSSNDTLSCSINNQTRSATEPKTNNIQHPPIKPTETNNSSTLTSTVPNPALPLNEQLQKRVHTIDNNRNNIDNNSKYSVEAKNQKKSVFIPPTLVEILPYFIEKKATEFEAQKFHNYYSSNGWLVGGKTKMKDWQAAARNWLLNAEKFKTPQKNNNLNPNNLHVTNNKNYAEPL
ncbi:transcriptional regulator [Flavobacterium sp.]|uniref:transcriptional regulator n=1 Tax=Flavobacterium sp. TaxID=239 RepID=UPI00262CA519|nr:transcriptional regulator [Flavobacterium sp.]